VKIEPIFVFKRQGTMADGLVTGYHTATGKVPGCMERLKSFGQDLPLNTFKVTEV